MAEDFLALDYVIIGIWTKNLLHPDRPAPHSYQEIKTQFLAAGGALKSEVRGQVRTIEQTAATPANELAYSIWKVGDDTVILREDGLLLLTGFELPTADLLRTTVEKLSERSERQTLSLAPAPPHTQAAETIEQPLAEVLHPLNRGNLENARLWTHIDHQHDAHDMRKRYFEKIGIEIPDPVEEEKEAPKKESA